MYLLFTFSMACLYIGEVAFFAFIGIKEGARQAPLALILIIITAIWHMQVSAGLRAGMGGGGRACRRLTGVAVVLCVVVDRNVPM